MRYIVLSREDEMNRREFLLSTACAVGAVALSGGLGNAFAQAAPDAKIDWNQFKGTDRCYLA